MSERRRLSYNIYMQLTRETGSQGVIVTLTFTTCLPVRVCVNRLCCSSEDLTDLILTIDRSIGSSARLLMSEP